MILVLVEIITWREAAAYKVLEQLVSLGTTLPHRVCVEKKPVSLSGGQIVISRRDILKVCGKYDKTYSIVQYYWGYWI